MSLEAPLNSEHLAPVPTGGLVPLVADADGVMHWSAAIAGLLVAAHTHDGSAGSGGQLVGEDALNPKTGTGAVVLQNNPTINFPVIDQINGTTGSSVLAFGAVGTGDSSLTITSESSGTAPRILANGSPLNVSINAVPKGAGTLQQNGIPVATTTDAQTLTNKTVTDLVIDGTITVPNLGLHLQSGDPAFDLIFRSNESLTADRQLRIATGDATRALTIPGDATVSGTNTGDQTITLTGDVTGTGTGSFAATIANDAVAFAKMQNSSVASVLVGRGSASGAGDFQEITLGSGLSMAGTVLSSSGAYTDEQAQDAVGAMVDASLTYVDATPLLQRAALTGDVTASAGSNATAIAADAVTMAKLANIATQTVIGRGDAGTGDPSACTFETGISITTGEVFKASGRWLRQTVYLTGSGTHTPGTDCNSQLVRVFGNGGGGGGADQLGAGQAGAGAGGGAGAKCEKRAAVSGTYAYVIPAAAAGGTAGPNTGATGGDVTFTGTNFALVAKGGIGGTGGPSTATSNAVAGGSGVLATGGAINGAGACGTNAAVINGAGGVAFAGVGGSTEFGRGGGGRVTHGAGATPVGIGGGGGGAVAITASTPRAGSVGAEGAVIVDEFS